MKLPGEQLVLDTNVLLHWLRGREAGEKLRALYELGSRRPRPIVPVVVKGELLSLALQFGWGAERQRALEDLLRELPVADVSAEVVVREYAQLDHDSQKMGRKMGKNDLWIAAIAKVQRAILLTTDQDFAHLHPTFIQVEYVELASLQAPMPE
jgi:tRNA(fMet)-specific endonuclease VapC